MSTTDLRQLSRLHGIQLSYADLHGTVHHASTDTQLAFLRALGVGIDKPEQAGDRVRQRRRDLSTRLVPPVIVSWDSQPVLVPIAVGTETDRIELEVQCEGGQRIRDRFAAEDLRRGGLKFEDPTVTRMHLPLPAVPMGYHRVVVIAGRRRAEATLISAPRRLPQPLSPTWGLFAPLYGLKGELPSGGATIRELIELGDWVGSMGGGVVATLPLLAGFMGKRLETSPYRPISRRLFNELYLDTVKVAQTTGASLAVDESEAHRLAGLARVDLPALMGHRRAQLEQLCNQAFANPKQRAELETFLGDRPEVRDYALFRANTSAREQPWPQWTQSEREGVIDEHRVLPDEVRFHQFVQWQLHQQLSQAADQARRHGPGLYLDLPVGVHPDGFDTWQAQDQFCLDVEVGAPPDDLNAGGQNWALPPLHPEGSRRHGHQHLRECLRAHLRYAGVLRIDHVMGLRRLFWIPRGLSARDGAYVRYPSAELFATLSVEAHRANAVVVGEDLGTVPDVVRDELDDHGARGMFVGMFSFGGQHGSTMFPPKADSVASFGTHDTATFAGFAEGGDIDTQKELGLIGNAEFEAAQQGRRSLFDHLRAHVGADDSDDGLRKIHDQLTSEMSDSDAWAVLVTLEDLWLEREPQNIPGTGAEQGNWSRKLARSIPEIRADADLRARLETLFHNRHSR